MKMFVDIDRSVWFVANFEYNLYTTNKFILSNFSLTYIENKFYTFIYSIIVTISLIDDWSRIERLKIAAFEHLI